jgi:hypothetical protein
MLYSSPAAADGQIFATVMLTNNSNACITIPFSGASTGSLWGTQGDTVANNPEYVVMPDGTPPRILAPGQTMLWGTKSNGGLNPSGTGGSLDLPLALEQQIITLSWSVPWTYINGGLGSPGTDVQKKVTNGSGFPGPSPFDANGSVTSCGSNGCIFAFQLIDGPAPGTMGANGLPVGDCLAMATSCPSGMSCTSGKTALVSPDGSTTLKIQGTPAKGGTMWLSGPGGFWWTAPSNLTAVQMLPSGNLVGYDSAGDVVWSTNTSGANSFLTIGTNEIAVETPGYVCLPRIGCTAYTITDWSASTMLLRIP